MAQACQRAALKGSEQLAISGMGFLVMAMVGVLFVITDILFGSTTASGATAAITYFFLYFWFVMPIRYRLKGR